jgi:hypothetical protein
MTNNELLIIPTTILHKFGCLAIYVEYERVKIVKSAIDKSDSRQLIFANSRSPTPDSLALESKLLEIR